eukprot:gb/GECG01015239.1/.p1 GENE.gb/GECG01015239.1/~~gb/GECG01015239.1/.p1  ORF type:complete len:130 (+),score=9.00 gb/GECG01015239.1/:1-390(+)
MSKRSISNGGMMARRHIQHGKVLKMLKSMIRNAGEKTPSQEPKFDILSIILSVRELLSMIAKDFSEAGHSKTAFVSSIGFPIAFPHSRCPLNSDNAPISTRGTGQQRGAYCKSIAAMLTLGPIPHSPSH